MFSEINVTTNNYTLAGLESSDGWHSVAHGKLPKHLICDFLHEGTHHWCYSLLVGYALATQRTVSAAKLWKSFLSDELPASEQVLLRTLQKELVIRTAGVFLDTIAEGLSIYAQFHLQPSPNIDQPILVAAAMQFLEGSEIQEHVAGIDSGRTTLGSDPIDELVCDLLEKERGSHGQIKVREHLLSLPLTLDYYGKYLTGYLFVLTIEAKLHSKLGRDSVESGVFLEWLGRVFFDDGILAGKITDNNGMCSPTDIMSYFTDRVEFLFSENSIECFRQFSGWLKSERQSWFKSEARAFNRWDLIGIDESICEHIRTTLPKANVEILEVLDDGEYGVALVWSNLARHFTSLGSMVGEVSVSSAGEVTFRCEAGSYKFKELANRNIEGEGTGELTRFFSQNLGGAAVLFLDDQMIWSMPSAQELRRSGKENFLQHLILQRRCKRLCEEVFENYHSTLNTFLSDGQFDDVRNAAMEVFDEHLMVCEYLPKRDSLVQGLRESGLFSLVSFDLALFKEIVGSQVPTSSVVRKGIEESLSKLSMTESISFGHLGMSSRVFFEDPL